MAAPKQPAVWVEVRLEEYPGPTTTVYRWATRPLVSVPDGFVEGRLDSIGRIRRALSDSTGQYDVSSASIVVRDDDGLIRGLLAEGEPTRWFENREAAIKVLSDVGLAAALDPRPMLRGVLTDLQLKDNRKIQVDLVDRLAPYLDREIPQALFSRQDFADIHRDLVGTPIPLIGGEHSDAGAVDVSGALAEKGMCPAIFVGQRMTIDNADDAVPSHLAPPANLAAAVTGTAGLATYFYTVTAFSPYGETVIADVATVTTGNARLSDTNYVGLTWDAVAGATAYGVYGRSLATPTRRLTVVYTNAFNDTGIYGEGGPAPPAINTAQVPLVNGGFFWDFYVVCLGVANIQAIYASNLAQGTAPKRMRVGEDNYGVTFLAPGHAGWPHADPWVDIGGMRITGFYARGPVSQQHIDGIVTMAVTTCGYEDVGDGSGSAINQAFPLLQHFLNEFVLKNDGEGYRTGDWGPLEEWDDSNVPILQTSKFADAQTLTENRLGDAVGYTTAIYIRESITVRAFLQRFCQTFDCFLATNHHGQLYPVLINDLADPAAGREYRERIEIARLPAPSMKNDAMENRLLFQYDYDPDARKFRNDAEMIQDIPAQDSIRGRVIERTIQQYYTRDAVTARDAMARRLLRVKVAPRYQPIVTNYLALEDENGDQIRITHRDGIGVNGYEQTPFLIIEHITEPGAGDGAGSVTLTGFDLSRLIGTAFPAAFSAAGEFVEGLEMR